MSHGFALLLLVPTGELLNFNIINPFHCLLVSKLMIDINRYICSKLLIPSDIISKNTL